MKHRADGIDLLGAGVGISLEPGTAIALGCDAAVGDIVPTDGGCVISSGVGRPATGDPVAATVGGRVPGMVVPVPGDAVGKGEPLADVGSTVLGVSTGAILGAMIAGGCEDDGISGMGGNDMVGLKKVGLGGYSGYVGCG